MSALPARILYVDDDSDTCLIMQRLLSRQGYDCCTAGTCAKASGLLQEQPIDLLITDFLLPDGDGLRVLEEARRRYPVEGILVTGLDADPIGAVAGAESGWIAGIAAEHFARRMIKPIEFSILLGAVGELLDPRRRAALTSHSVDAARTAERARTLRQKVKAMTTDELSALAQTLRRRGEDLKEETQVIADLVRSRQQTLGQTHQP